MRTLQKLITVASLTVGLVATAALAADETTTTTTTTSATSADINKVSEAFGHLIGRNLESPGLHFDIENVITGIRNAAAGKDSPMTEEEYEEAMAEIQENAFNTLATENLEKADTFMQTNASKDGVVEIEATKLQYEVLQSGSGAAVSENGTPTIHYVGTYSDGTVFGSSEEGGGPVTLPLDQTIPGFSKGIAGMQEGEKRRLYIHPDMGYGTGGHLVPNSLLVFDIEVVSADSTDSATTSVATTTASTTDVVDAELDDIDWADMSLSDMNSDDDYVDFDDDIDAI